MSVFDAYSRYYDLLYKDKDYQSEVNFVDRLIHKYNPDAKSILDLGCGTGRHDIPLCQKGYALHGVDQSEQMLAMAQAASEASSNSVSEPKLSFHRGDIRSIQLNRKFDAVISLFHVMSYLPENSDFRAVLNTAKKHLIKGGIFLFDFWYGPAVLTDTPSVRVKYMEDDRIKIKRTADPLMHPNENLVDVRYTISIENKENGNHQELKETHRMRYWFMPEIVMLLSQAGFELLEKGEWLTENPPGFDTWNVFSIGQAV